jgi:choline dehydrogenase-like flavoprotein
MDYYDIIIIGTGAGGGSLIHRLKDTGKKILILERGPFLPREKENWDAKSVFQQDRYHTTEEWIDRKGNHFSPGTGYYVGGNTKVYGAALLRMREKDFNKVQHEGGVSPSWPLKYQDFAAYYDEAEQLYEIHGNDGEDPTEPGRNKKYPFPAVSHEPRIQELYDNFLKNGYKPFHLPLGIKLDENNALQSNCIRCNTCDGFPCLVHAKSDADINCIRPAMRMDNITLLTETKVTKLTTNKKGDQIDSVLAEKDGEILEFKSDIVVVSCGAINSAFLLLNSANDQHPNGLANRSDQVGRNFMKHNNGALLSISNKPNPTKFQKTMGLNDFYWGDNDFEYPMGHIQLLGTVTKDMLRADAPSFAPGFALEQVANHAIGWWITGEDLPHPDNRVEVRNQKLCLHYTENNIKGFNRLMQKLTTTLKKVDDCHHFIPHSLYFKKIIPLAAVGHQNGTLRFGENPKTSVLDINCKTHEIDNLYVVDGSFFPSSSAVNPSLTIIANALRVGDHLIERMG